MAGESGDPLATSLLSQPPSTEKARRFKDLESTTLAVPSSRRQTDLMTAYRIVRDDLMKPAVLALLQFHLDEMHRWSPADKIHAMPAKRLRAADVTFFSAWDGETVASVGALRDLGAGRGELKSMRSAPGYRGKGAGRAMLDRLLDEARARRMTWLGLETGRAAAFRDAQALYTANGFVECAPFGDYVSDIFSMCMERRL